MDTSIHAPRAYSYLRFSSPEQARGDSLRRQTELAADYAKRNGLILDTELNLKDLGVSAFRGDNAAVGALGAFLRAIIDGLVPPGSLLLVEALDRISRQTARKAVRILEDIVDAGVILVTLNDGKRYTKASLDGTDFLMAILLFMRGAEESATKSKRLAASWVAKRARAAKGEVQSAMVPAWLRIEGSVVERNARLHLIPDRVRLLRRIFEQVLDGVSMQSIIEKLNADRIPTWGGGLYWHKSYMLRLLRCQSLIGHFVPRIEHHQDGKVVRVAQAPIKGYFPVAIDPQLFERVQSVLDSRRGGVRSKEIASSTTGLLKCVHCGGTMRRINSGGPRPGKAIIVCARAKSGAGCKYKLITLRDVEQALVDAAQIIGVPPSPNEDVATRIKELDNEVHEVSAEIDNLVMVLARRPSKTLEAAVAEREAKIETLVTALEELRDRASDSESRVVNLRAKRASDLLRSSESPAKVNAALRECFEKIVVDWPSGALWLHWRHGGEPTRLTYAWA